MALVLKDRVKGWTDSYGEDNFVIFATTNGYQSFSVIGNGNQTYYTVFDPTNYDWEVGIGTYTAATTTLSRDTILSSSNNDLIVSFLPGTKELFVGYPAEKAVTLDTPQTITDKTLVNATVTSGTINNTTIGATTPASGAFTTLVASGASLTSVNAGVALLTSATVTTLNATSVSIASANVGNLQGTAASIGSINAGVAVVTNLTATGASVASINAGVALFTNATTTTLNATGASIASANIGNLQFTAASIASINAGVAVITNLTATGASIASANVGNAVISAATVTGASIASANLGTAVITTGTVTNLTATSASVASANAAVALVTTGTVTSLTSTGASIASANLGTAVITGLTATGASIASANIGTAVITTLTATGASIASVNAGVAVLAAGTAALPSLTTTGDTNTGIFFPAADTVGFSTGGSERMRLDTSGNLGIGTTSPGYRLDTQTATSITQARFSNSATGGATITSTGASQAIWAGGTEFNGTAFVARATTSSQIRTDGGLVTFFTNDSLTSGNTFTPTERMRIDSSGNVGIGGTANAFSKLNITGTLASSGANSLPMYIDGTIPSTTTSQAQIFRSNVTTQATSFTLNTLAHFMAGAGSGFGAGSTVTTHVGFWANSDMIGGTNNYGFYSDIASGANRWNFYANGTAQNYFAGTVSVATTSTAPGTANVVGVALGSAGYVSASRDSAASAEFNRKTNDGDIIVFEQDGTAEGSISVSGNTISYNAFAGSHWSQLQDDSKPDILRGTVMESINELCVWPGEQNERLPKSKISDTAGSKKVYGVFMAWDNDWTATNDMLVTAVGAFICRVNSSVTVQEGDLLESNGDGTARVQADDIIRSSTIGKVTSTVKTHQYADGSYCVPTVLYCG